MKTPTVRLLGAHSSPFSGAAVVHTELATRLPQYLPDGCQFEDVRLTAGLARRLAGSPTKQRANVTILTSTPMPVMLRSQHLVPVIHDVRWRWTRGTASRWYRYVDLRRTLRRATHTLTVSHAVEEQLRALRCHPGANLSVVPFGPGQFQGFQPAPVNDRPRTVILVGGAPHKRNELAAELLGQLPEVRSQYDIIAVSVSPETRAILRRSFDAGRLEFLDHLSAREMADAYARARSYVALGFSEGFGFPYVEAAYQGCDIVAPLQPVVLEVLGQHAVHLATKQPTPADLQRALGSWSQSRIENLQTRATSLDWNMAARRVAAVIAPLLADADV